VKLILKKKLFYTMEKDGITQSLISMFLSCRRKAKLYLEGWDSKWFSTALNYGSLGHGMLEYAYTDVSNKKLTAPPSMKLLQGYSNRAEKQWLDENPKPSTKDMVQVDLNLALLEQTLFYYFRQWEKDFNKVKWLALEEEIKGIECEGIPLRGKRDGKFAVRKEVWLLENKFKSRIEEDDLADSLNIDFQSLEYLWSSWKETGVVPSGMLYNVIRRTNLKQNKSETTDGFVKRVGKDIESRPEFYFMRFEIPILKSDLVNFEKDLSSIILDFKEWWTGKGRDYKNPYNCLGKYGKCMYLNVCANNNFDNLEKRKKVFKELEDLQ